MLLNLLASLCERKKYIFEIPCQDNHIFIHNETFKSFHIWYSGKELQILENLLTCEVNNILGDFFISIVFTYFPYNSAFDRRQLLLDRLLLLSTHDDDDHHHTRNCQLFAKISRVCVKEVISVGFYDKLRAACQAADVVV